jgi:hypothetical protein
MTPIDTVYEYAGYSLAGLFHEILGGAALPLLVGLAGTAAVVHGMADRGSPKDLGVHLLTLMLVAWLLSPAEVQGTRAPRFAVWAGEAADVLQRKAVRAVNERFLESPFEYERVAAMAGLARVLDPALGKETDRFLGECARPALAKAAPRGPNVFRAGALAYPRACERRRESLWKGMRGHVRAHPLHRSAIEAARRRDPGGASSFEERYLDEMARRALDEGASAAGESARVAAALGEYSLTDPAQDTLKVPWWARPLGGLVVMAGGDRAANVLVSGASQLNQWWENAFTARQKYYLACVYGPHVYGLALLFVIGLFPVAGLMALWPGKWRALLNWGKVFVSVKLWPVLWAALSSFNARRPSLEAFDPAPRGSADAFLAVAAMYLLTPAIAYLGVNLAVSAAAMPFSPALPPPSGPGLGPVGAAAQGAGAAARLGR